MRPMRVTPADEAPAMKVQSGPTRSAEGAGNHAGCEQGNARYQFEHAVFLAHGGAFGRSCPPAGQPG